MFSKQDLENVSDTYRTGQREGIESILYFFNTV